MLDLGVPGQEVAFVGEFDFVDALVGAAAERVSAPTPHDVAPQRRAVSRRHDLVTETKAERDLGTWVLIEVWTAVAIRVVPPSASSAHATLASRRATWMPDFAFRALRRRFAGEAECLEVLKTFQGPSRSRSSSQYVGRR
jgi:hypothetical protein